MNLFHHDIKQILHLQYAANAKYIISAAFAKLYKQKQCNNYELKCLDQCDHIFILSILILTIYYY